MRRAAAGAIAAALAAMSCASQPKATNSPPPKPVLVFAAASLTKAFTALKPEFEKANPGYRLQFNFAGTPTLLTQLQQGAKADLFASADETNMGKAVSAGLVTGGPKDFAHNLLEIAVAPGNPEHIGTLGDLANPKLKVVLAAANVPAGKYAVQALGKAGVTVHPKSLEVDVESTLAKVELGQADAAIVYQTDVKAAGAKVTGVPIPAADNVVATYPIAQVASDPVPAGADAFIRYLLSAPGRQTLSRYGFQLP